MSDQAVLPSVPENEITAQNLNRIPRTERLLRNDIKTKPFKDYNMNDIHLRTRPPSPHPSSPKSKRISFGSLELPTSPCLGRDQVRIAMRKISSPFPISVTADRSPGIRRRACSEGEHASHVKPLYSPLTPRRVMMPGDLPITGSPAQMRKTLSRTKSCPVFSQGELEVKNTRMRSSSDNLTEYTYKLSKRGRPATPIVGSPRSIHGDKLPSIYPNSPRVIRRPLSPIKMPLESARDFYNVSPIFGEPASWYEGEKELEKEVDQRVSNFLRTMSLEEEEEDEEDEELKKELEK